MRLNVIKKSFKGAKGHSKSLTHQLSSIKAYFLSQGPKVKQFMDIFSIPEMTLLAAANDFFITNDIEYDPVHLFKDVSVSASLPGSRSVYNVTLYTVFSSVLTLRSTQTCFTAQYP